MTKQKANSLRSLDFVFLLAYVALSIIMLIYHEPWYDEAMNWLSVKHRTVSSVYYGIALDGHPMAWLLLIMPLAKLGLPYISVFIFHHFLNMLASVLFYRHAPFPRLVRILFLLTVYIAYDYHVIAKNYVLVYLVLVLLGVIYKQRSRYFSAYIALLIILINTHVYAAVIGISIVGMDIVRMMLGALSGKVSWKRIGLYTLATGLGTLVLVMGFLWGDTSHSVVPETFRPLVFLKRYFYYITLPFTYAQVFMPGFLLAVPAAICLGMLLYRNLYAAGIFIGSTIGVGLLYYLNYPHSGVHVGMLFLMTFYVLWIAVLEREDLHPWLSNLKERIALRLDSSRLPGIHLTPKTWAMIFGLITLPYLVTLSYDRVVREIRKPFSNAMAVADFIQDKGLDRKDTRLITYTAPNTLPILPFFKEIDSLDYYAYRRGTYVEWDVALGFHYEDYVNDMDHYFDSLRRWPSDLTTNIFVLDQPTGKPPTVLPDDFEELARFKGAIIPTENFVVFKLKSETLPE